MATTPTYALRYPVLTDAPNGPQAFQNLANDVEAQLVTTNGNTRFPVCIMTAGVDTTLGNSVFTSIAFSTEQLDTASGHDTATNNSRYTCQSGWAGYYGVSASTTLRAGGTTRAAVFAKNGATLNYTEFYFDTAAQSSLVLPTAIIQMAVGDYLEFQGFVNAAGIATVSGQTQMTIAFLRPL